MIKLVIKQADNRYQRKTISKLTFRALVLYESE